MKNRIFFSAVIALLTLTACQKDDSYKINEEEEIVSPVFTASIGSQDSKTIINVNNGKVSWEMDDVITVTNENSQSATYKVKSIDQTTGKATFVIKDGETPLTGNSFTATYGTAPSNSQTYSDKAGKLYMTAPSTESRSFTFTVQCALLKINLTKSGESIKSISVTSADGKNTYTLTCKSAQDISSAKDFYIEVPQGDYRKFVITNSSNKGCILYTKEAFTLDPNTIKKVTLSTKLKFSGLFSVSKMKKVVFSPGNLYYNYNGSAFKFESNQYDYRHIKGLSKDAAVINGASNTTPSGTYGSFRWANNSGNLNTDISSAISINTSLSGSDSDVFFTNTDQTTANPDFTVEGQKGIWRTLSKDEWTYLLNTDGSTENYRQDAKRFAKAMVNSVKGLIIFPDSYSGTTEIAGIAEVNKTDVSFPTPSIPADTWTSMESAGCVFLPAAGYRYDSGVKLAGSSANYWSSTARSDGSAYRLFFGSGNVFPASSSDRYYGDAVRLVQNVN